PAGECVLHHTASLRESVSLGPFGDGTRGIGRGVRVRQVHHDRAHLGTRGFERTRADLRVDRRRADGIEGLDQQHAERIDPIAHPRLALSGSPTFAAGTLKWNVLPWPGTLSTQMRPPCCSTMPLQITSPRPVPPALRVADESICENLWNSLGRSRAAMPSPKSRTPTRTPS